MHADGDPYRLRVKVSTYPRDATVDAEMKAISRMAQMDQSNAIAMAQWNFTQSFDTTTHTEVFDLMKGFPGFSLDTFDEFQRPAFANADRLPAAMMFVEGFPGSGKSALGVQMVGLICKTPNKEPRLKQMAPVAAVTQPPVVSTPAEFISSDGLQLDEQYEQQCIDIQVKAAIDEAAREEKRQARRDAEDADAAGADAYPNEDAGQDQQDGGDGVDMQWEQPAEDEQVAAAPADDTQPAGEWAAADDTQPAGEWAAADDTQFAGEWVAADDAQPVDEGVAADNTQPANEEVAADNTQPTGEGVAADEWASADDTQPADEWASADDTQPADEGVAADDTQRTTLPPDEPLRPDSHSEAHDEWQDPSAHWAVLVDPQTPDREEDVEAVDNPADNCQENQNKPVKPIVWCTPSHALCTDIVPKLMEATGQIVCHVHPLEAELRALTHANTPVQAQPDRRAMMPVEHDLLQTLDEFRKGQSVASRDPYSLSTLAMDIATNDPDWNHMTSIQRNQPHLWRNYADRYEERCFAILRQAITQCHVLVGTPVSLGQIADKFDLTARFLVVDEAARMTESSFWIPIAAFGGCPTLVIGDTRQFGPVSKNSQARGSSWRSTFGRQHCMSILTRASWAAITELPLTINRRNHGQIAQFVKNVVYNKEMVIPLSVEQHALVPQFILFFNSLFCHMVSPCEEGDLPTANSWVIDLQEGVESAIGTSFSNLASSNFTLELVRRIFAQNLPSLHGNGRASILIVAPYTAMVNDINAALDTQSDRNIVRSLVSARTIDSSMSFEADVVIALHVRSSKLGFTGDSKRVAVMTSRARLAAIYVVSTRDWEMDGEGRKASKHSRPN
ncbi:BIP4 [Verticillium alfalfae VaMs.102]|uniref:BIP4 n=1 Tax=Verticillium alfalfae (strain VaMs.102 / ATCC MYA-4576 / FGSC 10136) TaxID=526221 RepID=C9SSA4_VERA1|nr:BIP4 [Verticillium alfalfae VaMs.102]EEY21669.1 BIP4 [Verticillium alfalfae VaMs.102]